MDNSNSVIKEIKATKLAYELTDLAVEVEQVLKLMGFPSNEAPEPYPEMVEQELATIGAFCKIEGGFTIWNVEVSQGQLQIENTCYEVGKKISIYFRHSQKMAVFACTAGKGINDRIDQLTQEGDLLGAYIVDVIGSVIVEKAMDKVQEFVTQLAADDGLVATNRYSPGYCDWNVVEQHKLFSKLPDSFCGITLTDSALMQPIKTVSGMIGLGQKATFRPYSCDACNSTNCVYRHKK